jgi:putative ATPase
MSQKPLFGTARPPLAERMRPALLRDVLGMEELLGEEGFLKTCLEKRFLPSIVFWGPPGCGKTTLARLLAKEFNRPFLAFSAVTSGIKEIREACDVAARTGGILLFVDEIHRFNKAQQDAFLHFIEEGSITLIGATTENPSFELNAALLSRVKVIVLHPLVGGDIVTLLQRALDDGENGIGGKTTAAPEAFRAICLLAGGDARKAFNLLELAAQSGDAITPELVKTVAQRPIPLYDKAGEEHYNLISALHKSLRNSDPDAALYWLARMLAAGEDPLFIARRLMRAATEDIGLADPQALPLAVAAKEAVHFMGMPEAALALAELAVYLSLAPKSNSIYTAYGQALKIAGDTHSLPVPLVIRNAPTSLMKGLGYGDGYQYAHEYEEGTTAMECLPETLRGMKFYKPTEHGQEARLAAVLKKIEEQRKKMRGTGDG